MQFTKNISRVGGLVELECSNQYSIVQNKQVDYKYILLKLKWGLERSPKIMSMERSLEVLWCKLEYFGMKFRENINDTLKRDSDGDNVILSH